MAGYAIPPHEIFSQLYIGDYFVDTMDFCADEHAAFGLMLLHIWLGEKDPLDSLASIVHVDQAMWDEIAPSVMPPLLRARANIEKWKAALRPYDGMRLPPQDWHIVRTIVLVRDGYP